MGGATFPNSVTIVGPWYPEPERDPASERRAAERFRHRQRQRKHVVEEHQRVDEPSHRVDRRHRAGPRDGGDPKDAKQGGGDDGVCIGGAHPHAPPHGEAGERRRERQR
eukprot:188262-Prorocentrum_minimum.AAC.1